jgi:hypothetical protein
MCIGAHVREGGVGFRERIGLVDRQTEFAGFHCWQQIGWPLRNARRSTSGRLSQLLRVVLPVLTW